MDVECTPNAIVFLERCVRRLWALEAAQRREDPQYATEYRYALVILTLTFEGNPQPVITAAYRIYGCHPDQVWPRTLADRKARLGKEWPLWYEDDGTLKPDRIVADWDYSVGQPPALPLGRIA